MISLLYKILGDINPLKKAVTKDAPDAAAKGGAEMGKVMGQQFKGAVMKYLGLGFLTSEFTKVAQEAAQIMKDAIKAGVDPEIFQVMTKAAEMTGKSLDELKEQMKMAPAAWAEMVEGIRKQGGIISNEDIEKLAEANAAIAEMKTLFTMIAAKVYTIFKWLMYSGTQVSAWVAKGLASILPPGATAGKLAIYGEEAQSRVDAFMDSFVADKPGKAKKGAETPGQKFNRKVGEANLAQAAKFFADYSGMMDKFSRPSAAGSSAAYGYPNAGARSPYISVKPTAEPRDMDRLIEEVTGVKRVLEEKL